MRSLLLLALLSLPAFAQEATKEFEIIGTKRVTMGVPFVAKIPRGYAAQYWYASKQVDFRRAPFQATVTAPRGKHTITCEALRILWDEQRTEVDIYEFEFFVDGTIQPDPDPDPTEPDPDPVPELDTAKLEKWSRETVARLNEPEVAEAIRTMIQTLLTSLSPTDTFEASFQKGNAAFGAALDGRRLLKDWHKEWRAPVTQWIGDNVKTSQQYIDTMKALARTFGGSSVVRSFQMPKVATRRNPPITKPFKRRVWFYTGDDCRFCEQWKREVKPRFLKAGFEVIETKTDKGRTPRFIVEYGEDVHPWNGYLDIHTATEILGEDVWTR